MVGGNDDGDEEGAGAGDWWRGQHRAQPQKPRKFFAVFALLIIAYKKRVI